MFKIKMIGLFLVSTLLLSVRGLQLKQGAYEDLVVSISDNVPSGDCQTLLTNLKVSYCFMKQFLQPKL